ncbi:hypothetical protein [Symmachiella dynata]|uniref:hypothetical protein n=1 Tax=Symmachiella dynata TaxID=2527995 RepID=UPI0030ECB154
MNIAASDETMRMNPTAVYVGRQAIYNSRLKVAAYELLYRDSHHNRALFIDGEEATGQLLLNTFVDIGSISPGRDQRLSMSAMSLC